MPSLASGNEIHQQSNSVGEQVAMLQTLRQSVRDQQKAAHQAFASLDKACCAMEASMMTSPVRNVSDSATSNLATSETMLTLPASVVSSSSTTRGFVQLLRCVEVLHQFLFTNVYMHYRQSVLSFMTDVERSVLGGGSVDLLRTTSNLQESADIGGSGVHGADSSHMNDEQRELHRRITELRYQLSRPAQLHIGGRLSSHTDGLANGSPPQGWEAMVADTSFTRDLSLRQANTKSDGLSAGLWSLMDAASSSGAHIEASALPQQGSSRHSVSRVRLFAVSSLFRENGIADQRELDTAVDALQRRYSLHAVQLSPSSIPEEEEEVALRLNCFFLVVPHRHFNRFPMSSPLTVTSDETVFRHLRRLRNQEEGEDLARGTREDVSALEELFLLLEADMPPLSVVDPVWSLPSSTPAVERSLPSSQEVIVQRAALHRDGCRELRRWKRHRSEVAANPAAHPIASTATEGVAVPTRVPTAHPKSTADLFRPSSHFHDIDTARLLAGAVADAVCPALMYDGVPSRDTIIRSTQFEESQYVGITQNVSLSHSPATPSDSAHVTPVMRPQEATPRAVDTAAPTTAADSIAPNQLVFQISNSVKYLKAELMEAITQLGGVVEQSSGYSQTCCYLVVAEGITERTEKYLGACAATTYIVPPRFVFDSQRRGYWLVSRAKEYDMNPQRVVANRPHATPIFSNWRVVLITCRSAAARGVLVALLAGGCRQATAFVVDPKLDPVMNPEARLCIHDETSANAEGIVEDISPTSELSSAMLQSATHILIECSSVTAQGYFQMPCWVPVCVRQPEYEARIFTLELLYFCLCAHPERIFGADGLLSDVEALTPSCRIESSLT